MQTTLQKRKRRHARIRTKADGTATRPRLAVFRSNKHITAQLIDDTAGETLFSSHTRDIKNAQKKPLREVAKEVGVEIAKKAKGKKITNVVFDRGGFSYTGAVKALAEGAREEGLVF